MTKSVFLACLSAWEVSKIIDWFFLEIFLTKKSSNLTDWRLIWLYIRPSLSLWYLFHLELGGCIALGIGRLPLQFRLGIWPDFWTKPHYQAPRHLAKLQRQKQSKVSPVMIALRLLIKKQVFKILLPRFAKLFPTPLTLYGSLTACLVILGIISPTDCT